MNWDEIWTQVQTALGGNQFLSGGLVLGVLGTAAALMRQWPMRIYGWLMHRLFIELEIGMNDEAFWWFYDWMATQPYGRERSRSLSVRSCNNTGKHDQYKVQAYLGLNGYGAYECDTDAPVVVLTPAPGTHWLFWRGRFMIVKRVREEPTGGSQKSSLEPDKERFYVSILTFDRSLAMQLMLEARKLAYPPEDIRVDIYIPGGHATHRHWAKAYQRQPRPAGSVVLAAGVLEGLNADIAKFRKNKSWYMERGIPYRRGYLLHGPPGNGKSSAVLALASEHNLNICVVNVGNTFLGDEELMAMISNLPDNSILLIEDIDCIFQQREGTKDKDNKLTFSGLLNALDGVAAAEGHILVMTTNHPEQLDPALVRPGRCDRKVHISNATQDQARKLFLRFFPEEPGYASDFANSVEPDKHCMAAIQGHLIRNAHDVVVASKFVPGEPVPHGMQAPKNDIYDHEEASTW